MFDLVATERGKLAERPAAGRIGQRATPDTATLHWIMRVAIAACFIGHGIFGIITKAAWLPYFAIFGIPEAWAWRLMPVVGAVDITVGILTLFQPIRAVVLYMAFWGFQTACLRPLAGQGMWELFERAGNYGVPLAFLLLLGRGRSLPDWFSGRPMILLTERRASAISWTLRVATALLLIGHGGFDFAMHKDWSSYTAAIGIARNTLEVHPLRPLAGWLEAALGLLVLGWPGRGLLIFVFAWKLGTEALRPLAGEPIWEFIERGGSYGAPLALAALQGWMSNARALDASLARPARADSDG
jgi:hypothetical protein